MSTDRTETTPLVYSNDSLVEAAARSLRDLSLDVAERCDAWLAEIAVPARPASDARLRDAQLERIAAEVAESFDER